VRVALNCLSGVAPNNGARVYVTKLAHALAQISGLEIVLLAAKGEARSLPRELWGLAHEIDVPPARSYGQISQARTISRALREAEIDVVHLPNTLPPPWTTVPMIITIFDMAELHVRRYGKIRTAYRWAVNYIAAHKSKAVITISQRSKSDISRYLKVSPDKIVVTHLGVGDEFVPGEPENTREVVRRRFGVDRFLLFPGGIAPNKNVEGAIKAFAEFRRRTGTLTLLVTGEGPREYLRSLQRLSQRLNVDNSVVWTGCLQREELPLLYRAAEAVIYPSLHEGFGLPILEAMASGCPVIAANTSSLPEVAGGAALLVGPEDTSALATAMQSVLSSEGTRRSLVQRGLLRAAEFSWAKTAVETYRVYENVMRREGRAADSSPST